MFEEILREIQAHDTIILHRHHHPDGDALGSQIGLRYLLNRNYPDKSVFIVGDAPGRYSFMQGSVMDEVPDEAYASALAILLDTATPSLDSDERYRLAHRTARIDHHLYVETFTDVEVIDSSFESCCGMVTAMAVECGWALSLDAATALYTGMVTDSGRFRYDATSARTHRLAAFLLEQPIDTNALYRHLYANDLEDLRLRARFIERIERTENGAAYLYTDRQSVAEFGRDAHELSRGMVNLMADIRGVRVWVNFTESDEGVLCELRSDGPNVNPIAVKYGGGGHQKASGAIVESREEAMRMVRDLDEIAGGTP